MHNIIAVRVLQYHNIHRERSSRILLDISRNRFVYTSKKFLSSKSNKSVSNNNDTPPTTATASKIFDSLTSAASDVVSKATKKATQAASEATDVAATNAKTVATKATNNIRHSITNAKIDAKQAGEQYAWEAHRSISKMGDNMKQSAKVASQKTSEHMKQTISNVSQSATNRLRDEISQRIRIPEMPKLSSIKKKKQPEALSTPASSTAKSTTVDAPSCESKKVIPNNYALPSKEQLLQSATYIATETATKTAANVTTQVSEGVHKATRWFWWWSLAAVGVYGISTTLTREGVQMIKDMFTSSKKESLYGDNGSSSTVIGAVNSSTVDNVNDDKLNEKSSNSGRRWLSSWFSLQASRDGQDDSSQ